MKKRKTQVFGVVGVCVNDKAQVLITKRHEPNRKSIHGKWQVPGGGIEFGESSKEAIIREIKEEVGCKVKIVKLIPYVGSHVYRYEKSDNHVILVGYVLKIIEGAPVANNYETAKVKWIKPDKIDFSKCLDLTREFLVAGDLLK